MSKFKFILDENVPKKVGKTLIAQGFDVITVIPGTDDVEIGEKAKRQGRVILTFDKDFANSLLFKPEEFSGIVRLRIIPPIPAHIIESLNILLSSLAQKDLVGKLILLERDGLRILR